MSAGIIFSGKFRDDHLPSWPPIGLDPHCPYKKKIGEGATKGHSNGELPGGWKGDP